MNDDVLRVASKVKANYPLLTVRTFEQERFITELSELCNGGGEADDPMKSWKIVTWDIASGFRHKGKRVQFTAGGLQVLSGEAKEDEEGPQPEPEELALAALKLASAGPGKVIYVFKNIVWFINNLKIIQHLMNCQQTCKEKKSPFIFLTTPGWHEVPTELSRDIYLLNHDLPTRSELAKVFNRFQQKPDNETHQEQMLDAAMGMTMGQFEDSIADCLVETKGKLVPSKIYEIKTNIIERTAGLIFSKYSETFTNLVGLANPKEWALDRFSKFRKLNLPLKGMIMTGLPGNGKSHFAKALGNEVGWPCVTVNLGEVLDKYVGESPRKFRELWAVLRALAPVIALFDEIEKTFGGVGTESSTNVYQELGSIFLTEMDKFDPEKPVFVICTSNDLSKLPPEYLRLGRFDALYFVDNPRPDDARKILDMYLKDYWKQEAPANLDNNRLKEYSGAELRQIAIEAAYRDSLDEALKFVVPIAQVRKERYADIRRIAMESAAYPADDYSTGQPIVEGAPITEFIRTVNL